MTRALRAPLLEVAVWHAASLLPMPTCAFRRSSAVESVAFTFTGKAH
jgi:hypothetical protein